MLTHVCQCLHTGRCLQARVFVCARPCARVDWGVRVSKGTVPWGWVCKGPAQPVCVCVHR